MSARSIASNDAPADLRAATYAPEAREVGATALRLRAARDAALQPLAQIAAAIAETCGRLGSIKRAQGSATGTAVAERWGWPASSIPIDLVCEPWSDRKRVWKFGQTLRPRRELIGFILPGNLPGAGLHEIAAALLAGCAVIVKTATAEPVFFADFARTLTEVDAGLGARLAVFNWGRERTALTTTMRAHCDQLVVFGDDTTIAELAGSQDSAVFGARVSGIVVAAEGPRHSDEARLFDAVAREVACFEQRGCLSPHHVFVGASADHDVRDWARRLARTLDTLGQGPMPSPRTLTFDDAAAIRRVRETARWRALGGHPVELWEGPLPGWTVVYDREASFTLSPGFRTVWVSPFFDAADLERRLEPVAGRLEGVGLTSGSASAPGSSIGTLRSVIERAGATWICEPGQLQTPPVDWLHCGGGFLRMLRGAS